MVIQSEFYYIPSGNEKDYVPLKKRQPSSSSSAPAGAPAPDPPQEVEEDEPMLPAGSTEAGRQRRIRAKARPSDAGLAHNLLGESLEDFTTEDNQTTFDQALWQCTMSGKSTCLNSLPDQLA